MPHNEIGGIYEFTLNNNKSKNLFSQRNVKGMFLCADVFDSSGRLCYFIESEEEENVNYIEKYVAKVYKNLTVRFKVNC